MTRARPPRTRWETAASELARAQYAKASGLFQSFGSKIHRDFGSVHVPICPKRRMCLDKMQSLHGHGVIKKNYKAHGLHCAKQWRCLPNFPACCFKVIIEGCCVWLLSWKLKKKGIPPPLQNLAGLGRSKILPSSGNEPGVVVAARYGAMHASGPSSPAPPPPFPGYRR
jgi:hypothetical protein